MERGHQSDSRFERFFAEIFAELRPSGNCLVMVVKELFSKVRTLQNGELRFDRLAFGNQVFLPNDLPQTRIVRIDNDHTKQPCFSHETDAKWVQGLFEWGTAMRTFYALKPKPPSISDASSYAAQSSRHDYQSGESGSGGSRIGATRVLPQLGEFCAAFAQAEDEPYELVANAFALCKTHVQYDYHTNMPFPTTRVDPHWEEYHVDCENTRRWQPNFVGGVLAANLLTITMQTPEAVDDAIAP